MMVGSIYICGAATFMSPTLFISAGEASGEHYGALLAGGAQAEAGGKRTGR